MLALLGLATVAGGTAPPAAPAPLSHGPPVTELVPFHRGRRLSTVSTVAELTTALAGAATSIVLKCPNDGNTYTPANPCTYALASQLEITRTVTLEAEPSRTVVLDAKATPSANRRVLFINPGGSGAVLLAGLHITGGYCENCPHDPVGGGVLIWTGTVTMIECHIRANEAETVRARPVP